MFIYLSSVFPIVFIIVYKRMIYLLCQLGFGFNREYIYVRVRYIVVDVIIRQLNFDKSIIAPSEIELI
ncbi:hypothetical protein HDE68_003148 [Pedobacter cryoconitis]|uniref:Uncharacterized protein n=1 Tax=Pedobacter cryoconitis TaxID=188932 RepID=A0A7W8ZNV0_9SPHI|nr:hypothetical protein [Pedobacter cryoconitis]